MTPSKWIPDTIPGVPARATFRVAPCAPASASSGIATTLRRWVTAASAVLAPVRRSSAVSVPLSSVQTYRKNVRVWAATPVTVCVCDAVPHPPIPRPALSLDTMTW